MNRIVGIRGGGDLATGVAWRLHQCGFKVYIMEIPQPLMVRRTVSFGQAILDGSMTVEKVRAEKIFPFSYEEVVRCWENRMIPVLIDPIGESISALNPDILVDCTLAKRNLGTKLSMAPIVIGVGPGFTAGVDVHYVIESMRGHFLGTVISIGDAIPDTGEPESVMGYTHDRVIRALDSGVFSSDRKIGEHLEKGEILGFVANTPIPAKISGVLRGLIANGTIVPEGMKIADIDPRDDERYVNFISDKARSIGGGVLEAILRGMNEV